MAEVKLSSKNQIVIPKEAREALKIRAGDVVEVVAEDDFVVIFKRPKSWEKAIRGLARGMYPEGYLERERNSWD